jgi:hypothetical protein
MVALKCFRIECFNFHLCPCWCKASSKIWQGFCFVLHDLPLSISDNLLSCTVLGFHLGWWYTVDLPFRKLVLGKYSGVLCQNLISYYTETWYKENTQECIDKIWFYINLKIIISVLSHMTFYVMHVTKETCYCSSICHRSILFKYWLAILFITWKQLYSVFSSTDTFYGLHVTMINIMNALRLERPNSWFLKNVPLFLRNIFLSFVKGTLSSLAVSSYDAACTRIDIECHSILVARWCELTVLLVLYSFYYLHECFLVS